MEKKICSKCGVGKDFCEFNKRKNRKGKIVLRGYCKVCHTEQSIYYAKKNPDNTKRNRLKWYKNNSKNLISKLKEKRNTDVLYKLRIGIRTRIKQALGGNFKRGKTIELLGIDIVGLSDYLESKFTEGMSWENYGLHGWHIDHIIPLSSAKTIEEFNILCHYTNLQPLWAKDNLKKSNKLLN
jgi:hypothetical protein